MRSSETSVELGTQSAIHLSLQLRAGGACPELRVPALERIHQLPGCLETPPHEHRLLAHHSEGIFEQTGLVFNGGRRRHCVLLRWRVRGCGERWSVFKATPRWMEGAAKSTCRDESFQLAASSYHVTFNIPQTVNVSGSLYYVVFLYTVSICKTRCVAVGSL